MAPCLAAEGLKKRPAMRHIEHHDGAGQHRIEVRGCWGLLTDSLRKHPPQPERNVGGLRAEEDAEA